MTEIRVAVPTDDGESISRHFGQARYFKILTVSEGRVVASELREKASHQHGQHGAPGSPDPGQQMVAAIKDCQAVISGGMGTPMLARLSAAGIEVYLTRQASIADAVQAFLAGTLENDRSLVHQAH